MSPLFDKGIVITRAQHQALELEQKLLAKGARPLLYPCVEIHPPKKPELLDKALIDLHQGQFEWLVLTSQNAVFALAERAKALDLGFLPRKLLVGAVGPKTAKAVTEHLKINPFAVPRMFDAQSLGELLQVCEGQRVLLPQADIARPALAQLLLSAKARLTEVTAYRTMEGTGGICMKEALSQNRVDMVAFLSPSAVQYFKKRLKREKIALSALNKIGIACIGHVTKRAAHKLGFLVHVAPDTHTSDALIEHMEQYYELHRLS